MPTINLSDTDLALIRKSLRRMAERHGTDGGARYDRVCGLIDDQLSGGGVCQACHGTDSECPDCASDPVVNVGAAHQSLFHSARR